MLVAKLGYDVLPYVVSIVVAPFGIASRHVGPYLKAKVGEKHLSNIEKQLGIAEQQVQQKKGWAYDAVLWAEDALKNLGGQEKLSKAVNWALSQANKLGIKATKQELEDVIRIAYTDIKPRLPKELGVNLDSNTPSDKCNSDQVQNIVGGDETTNSQSEEDTADVKPSIEQASGEAPQSAESEQVPAPAPPQEKPIFDMTTSDLKQFVAQVIKDQAQPDATIVAVQ
jgi:hypothetical protein